MSQEFPVNLDSKLINYFKLPFRGRYSNTHSGYHSLTYLNCLIQLNRFSHPGQTNGNGIYIQQELYQQELNQQELWSRFAPFYLTHNGT